MSSSPTTPGEPNRRSLQPAGTTNGNVPANGVADRQQRQAANLLPAVTAPRGGGAISGLDEKLAVNARNRNMLHIGANAVQLWAFWFYSSVFTRL